LEKGRSIGVEGADKIREEEGENTPEMARTKEKTLSGEKEGEVDERKKITVLAFKRP